MKESLIWRDPATGRSWDLTSGAEHPDGWRLEVVADGTEWGGPEARTSVRQALVSSGGDLVEFDGNGNRVVNVQARLSGPSTAALASGEAFLDRLLYRRTELEWTPPDSLSVPTVWDVETSERGQVYGEAWDLMEARDYTRTLAWKFTCRPDGRSVQRRRWTSGGAAGVLTVVDSADSATGWSSTGAAPTVVSGRVISAGTLFTLTRTGTIATPGQRYVAVDWSTTNPAYYGFDLDDIPVTESLRQPLAGGLVRSWLAIPAGRVNVASLRIGVAMGAHGVLSVDQVATAQSLPNPGTDRQKIIGATTPGSVTTAVDVTATSTGTLGFALIHTGPAAGTTPSLSVWANTPGTPNTNLISGAYWDLSAGPMVCDVPAHLLPAGPLEVVGCLYTNTGANDVKVRVSAQGRMGTTNVGPSQSETLTTNFPSMIQERYIVSIGQLVMPVTAMGPAGVVRFTISQESTGHTVYVDETWTCSMGRDSALTIVEAASASRLAVHAPSPQWPQGAILVGSQPDGSDSHAPGVDAIRAWGSHSVSADGTTALLAVTGTPDPELALEGPDRYHTYAATRGDEGQS